MALQRVAITGIGLLSAAGRGLEAHLRMLLGAEPVSFASMKRFDPGAVDSPVAEVPAESFNQAAGDSRTDALALAAADDALRMAGAPLGAQTLVALGTTTGGIDLSEVEYLRVKKSPGPFQTGAFRRHAVGAVTDKVASRFGLRGERQTFSTACSSSANALGYAALHVATGRVPFALAGGVDALCQLTYFGFHSLRLLAPTPCRPFHAKRQGLSLGEAAAFFVLEPEEAARARGANIHGFVRGWGYSADAHHLTAPEPQGVGAAAAMTGALSDAGISPDVIQYINAHGTGTDANDRAEGLAMKNVFGSKLPPISSTKAMTGHTLGAAGALEAALSILIMSHSVLPPTLRLDDVAPELTGLPLLTELKTQVSTEWTLSTSFGFGGNNTALVLQRGLS